MATCGDHSGVCTNITDIKADVVKIDKRQREIEVHKVSNKNFYILISVLCVLAAGLFGMVDDTNKTVTRIEQSVNIQAVEMRYAKEAINEIEGRLP